MRRWVKGIVCLCVLLLLPTACGSKTQQEATNQVQGQIKTIPAFYESLGVHWNESRTEVEEKYGEAMFDDFDQEYYDIAENVFFDSVTPLDQFLTVLYDENDLVMGLIIRYRLSSEEEQQALLEQVQLACDKQPDAYFDGGAESQFYGYTLASMDVSVSCIRIDTYNYETSIQMTPH